MVNVAMLQDRPSIFTRIASVGLLLSFGLCGCATHIEAAGRTVTIHVETLGEYPSTIKSFQLVEATSKNIPIFRVEGKDDFQTWKFDLHTGQNAINSVDVAHGSYLVVAPVQQNIFILRPKTEYVATVCRLHHLYCSTEKFSFTD